jgi:hypothetical protein
VPELKQHLQPSTNAFIPWGNEHQRELHTCLSANTAVLHQFLQAPRAGAEAAPAAPDPRLGCQPCVGQHTCLLTHSCFCHVPKQHVQAMANLLAFFHTIHNN